MRTTNILTLLATLGLSGVLALGASACSDDNNQGVGVEGGGCYANGTCNAGLECRSNLCVQGNGVSNTGGGSSSNGVDIDDCFACGESSCSAENDACDASAGCRTVLECWLGCGTNASCQSACDTSQVTANDLTVISSYFTCFATECVSECTVSSTSGGGGNGGGGGGGGNGDGGGNSDAGAPCSATDGERGSCASDDAEACDGDTWQAVDCTACELISPSTTCNRVQPVTLLHTGDDYISVEATDLDYAPSSEGVTAEWYLESSQIGILQFKFDSEIEASRVDVSATGVSEVTLETEGGASGCTYTLVAGRLQRYYEADADGIAWNGCWGSFDSLGVTSAPPGVTVLNLRTTEASTNQNKTIKVTQLNI